MTNDQASNILCFYEGNAEKAILDILLDNDLLWFSRDQLVPDPKPLLRCSVEKVQTRYLRTDYGEEGVTIIRVIDSSNEEFKLKAAYQRQVKEVLTILTKPEIEILVIINEGKHKDFWRSKIKKPSDYCKQVLGLKNVKTEKFIHDYFDEPQKLVDAIREYDRLHRKEKGELSLSALLKK